MFISGRNPEIVSLVLYTMMVDTMNTITASVEISLSAGLVSNIFYKEELKQSHKTCLINLADSQ